MAAGSIIAAIMTAHMMDTASQFAADQSDSQRITASFRAA
jgi:hypothetical protein